MPTLTGLTRRSFLRASGAACAAAVAGCSLPPPRAAGGQRLQLLGETTLPHGMHFGGTTVGGLSGIDHDPATGTWAAISDDRSVRAPARFYTLRVDFGPGWLTVLPQSVVTLRRPDGTPYPRPQPRGEVVDPEALRLLPGGRGVLWTSEGDRGTRSDPLVREATLDGREVRAFDTPALLRFGGPAGTGPRNNETFEGLALTPDGRTAWVAMESALEQDGPEPDVQQGGGCCRFTAFDLASGRAVRQIAYQRDPLPHAPLVPGALAENGVSEILMIDAHRMLVLERAYVVGHGTTLRIHEIDTHQASDTLQLQQLAPGSFQPARKRLVGDFAQLGLARLDNTEGMCWGPPLPDGRRSLVVVSDDNFNPLQVTQFAAFAYLD